MPTLLATANHLLYVQGSFAGQGELSDLKTHQQIPMGQPCGRSTWCPSVVFSQTALGCSLPSMHACLYHGGAVAKQCPISRWGLEGHFRLFVSVHWISSLNCIKHIYLPDPTHCERRDHTELSATAAVCRIEKAHPYLFLWPKKSHDGSPTIIHSHLFISGIAATSVRVCTGLMENET